AVEQGFAGLVLEHHGELPREIGGVLHAGVASEATGRRHDVRRVAVEKYAALAKGRGALGGSLPGRDVLDLDVEVGDADRGADQLDTARVRGVAGDVGRAGQGEVAQSIHREEPARAAGLEAEEAALVRVDDVDHAELPAF